MANFLNESIEGFNELKKATDEWAKTLEGAIKMTKKDAAKVNPAKVKAEDVKTLTAAEKALMEVKSSK